MFKKYSTYTDREVEEIRMQLINLIVQYDEVVVIEVLANELGHESWGDITRPGHFDAMRQLKRDLLKVLEQYELNLLKS